MSEPTLVEMDTREPRTFYHEFLTEMDRKDPNTKKPMFKVELNTLEYGDFLFNKRIVVERKEAGDFINSIKDGRIINQMNGLINTYGKGNVYLVIEKDPIKFAHTWSKGFNIQSIIGVQRWCMQNGILYAERTSRQSVILFLKNLAIYSKKDEVVGTPTPIINKPKFDDVRSSQLGLMQIIPGIGYATSRGLLIEHGSPIEFFHNIIEDKLDTSTDAKKRKVDLWKHILIDKFEAEKI